MTVNSQSNRFFFTENIIFTISYTRKNESIDKFKVRIIHSKRDRWKLVKNWRGGIFHPRGRKCKQRGDRKPSGSPTNRREIILFDAVSAHSRAQRAQFPNVNRRLRELICQFSELPLERKRRRSDLHPFFLSLSLFLSRSDLPTRKRRRRRKRPSFIEVELCSNGR